MAQRNEISRDIGTARGKGDHAGAEAMMAMVAALKDRIPGLEAGEREAAAELESALSGLPNVAAPDVPDGSDESGNVVIHEHGNKPDFDFAPLEHDLVAARLGYDPEAAAKIAG